jgi:8-oxo-dGTP pyrophosphatase MutT (NUDIX family)
MQKTKVCLIVKNKNGEVLLQLRDEEPEAGKWVLFGGGIKDGETAEAALIREIKEELDYQIKSARFFKEYEDRGVCQLIYVLDEPVEIESLKLGEGSAMKFFTFNELQTLNIGFNFKQILFDYLG